MLFRLLWAVAARGAKGGGRERDGVLKNVAAAAPGLIFSQQNHS